MKRLAALLVALLVFSSGAWAQTVEGRMRILEETIKRLEQTLLEQKKLIEEMKAEYRRQQTPATRQATPGLLNPAIALIVDGNSYYSSLAKGELKDISIPGYVSGVEREFNKGFNLRAAEMTFFAPVDPYFNLYATIPITESGVELEEAYFVTTFLPAGLQLKGGKFKSGFGRLNAFHPHAWDFADAPLAYRAFLGEEGLGEKGVQLTYLPRLPVYVILGFEALQGDNPILFGPDAGSGLHAFTGFAKASIDFGSDQTILFGGSVSGGKTETETAARDSLFSGSSTLYGAELTYKRKPSKQKSLIVQTEYLLRHQDGKFLSTSSSAPEPLRRSQDGWYVQAVRQSGRWRLGARWDVLGVLQDDFNLSGRRIDLESRPYRLTGALDFNPTEFSRVRLQYNYDRSRRTGKANNEVLLQVIFAIGAHGAHPF